MILLKWHERSTIFERWKKISGSNISRKKWQGIERRNELTDYKYGIHKPQRRMEIQETGTDK